jgi:uncharacterized protein
MSINSVIQFFLPKEDKFYSILEDQTNLIHETTQKLATFSEANTTSKDVSFLVQELEHKGDNFVELMENELAKTFVTPIDREDLHALSVQLDDIADFCNHAVRSAVLFGIDQPTEAMKKLMSLLVKCTRHLNDVVPSLRKKTFSDFFVVKGAIKELEKEADDIYRSEVVKLYNAAKNDFSTFFAQKEVLDKLENAIDRTEDISQYLATLAVKNG